MSTINIQNLSFCHENSGEKIFNNVNLILDSDWKLGFVGRNGRGKTTFLHLLLKKYPYFGQIQSNITFDYFPFDIIDKNELVSNIIWSICPSVEHWEIKYELSLLQVDYEVLNRPFQTLSNGEQTKTLLAALFLKANNFLLLDEPTNHLDENSKKIIANYLKKSQKGFILVSHDRTLLDYSVDHILSLNKTNIEIHKGNFSLYLENKFQQDENARSKNVILKKEISELEKAAKQATMWANKVEKTKYGTRNGGLRPDRGYIGHKSAKMMKRAKTYESRQQNTIEEKSKLLSNVENSFDLEIKYLVHPKNILVNFDNVSIFYEQKVLFEHLNLLIRQGDRIALCGKNGSGKSSILKLLVGEKIQYHGTINTVNDLVISYIPQSIDLSNHSINDFIRDNKLDESLFRSIIQKLDLPITDKNQIIGELSDGQKRKILLAASISTRAHLYVWDEPLNYIDVISYLQIENLLLKYQPTIIFVEHDKTFIEKIATKIFQID